MKPCDKLRILIADDRQADLAAAKSALLASRGDEELSPGILAKLALEYLDIHAFTTVPAALAYLRDYGAPDFSIIDLDFSESRIEAPDQGEAHEEGLAIIEALLKLDPESPFVCFSNFIASAHQRLAEAGVLEHAIGKSNQEELTVRSVKSLRRAATIRLQRAETVEKERLFTAIKEAKCGVLPEIKIQAGPQIFLAKHLIIGWAEAFWDDEEDLVGLRFPENTDQMIKALQIQST